MEPTNLRTDQEVLDRQLEDPAFRERWERTILARAVAVRILAYRAERGLSQTRLARELGMKQPAVARLESGEHTPSLETLIHLSRTLGIKFLIDIAPAEARSGVAEKAEPATVVERFTARGSQVIIAVS